jgi:pyruvate kinase
MDVARLNLSHGSHAEHQARYDGVRAAAEATGKAVGILADLQGPKIRLGTFANGPVELLEGATFVITMEDVEGTVDICSTTYKGLAADVRVGDAILVDDGKVMLRVTGVDGPRVITRVEIEGVVSNNKGLNLPGLALSVPAMSEKDEEDLRWALRAGVDLIALSFVRSGKDVLDVHRIMDEEGIRLPVIAKVEKPQAVENLEDIVVSFDGVMVARGDLGVELPLEEVPLVQKNAVAMTRRRAKPVIVATQVLESMITMARPTRAEASDCANAVLDGADAIMLSGETSVGKYAIEAVKTMARIIEHVEEHGAERAAPFDYHPTSKGGSITAAAARVAESLGVKYLVCFTQSGDSARRMARLHSTVPLLAFTPLPKVRSELALTWGVETFLMDPVQHTDDMTALVEESLLALGRCVPGDLVVIVAGSPPGIRGSLNLMRVHRIGDQTLSSGSTYRVPV